MFRALLFLAFTLPGLSNVTLQDLVDASTWFSAAIRKQSEIVQGSPLPGELAQMTLDYARAKTHYFQVVAAMMPELEKIANGQKPMPPEMDNFAKALPDEAWRKEKITDEKTLKLLQRFYHDPEVAMAQAEFIQAQKVEEDFHREFD